MEFGKTSNQNLDHLHPDLVLIHQIGIETIRVDYGIHCGARTFGEQLQCFLDGSSKLDPRIPEKLEKAMHVITDYRPLAMATDIHVAASYKGKSLAWDNLHLTYVVSYLIGIADMLFALDKIEHKLLWGGNWDNNSIIQFDQNFDDNCHIQLYKP